MHIDLPPALEDKAEAAEASLDAALEEGLADLREGRFVELKSPEDIRAFFAEL